MSSNHTTHSSLVLGDVLKRLLVLIGAHGALTQHELACRGSWTDAWGDPKE